MLMHFLATYAQDPAALGAEPKYVLLYHEVGKVAVILLLIAALTTSLWTLYTGNAKGAAYVLMGALILFGGFWFFSLMAEVFSGNPTLAKSETIYTVPDLSSEEANETYVPQIMRSIMKAGLDLLACAITPFVVIHGMMLAVSMALKSTSVEEIKPFLLGSVVIFSSNLLAQIFLLIT